MSAALFAFAARERAAIPEFFGSLRRENTVPYKDYVEGKPARCKRLAKRQSKSTSSSRNRFLVTVFRVTYLPQKIGSD